MPGETPQTAGTPGQPPGQPQPQAPFGQSSAMGATPNKGHEVQGIQRLGAALKILETVPLLVGSTSDIGKEVMKFIISISKHLPEGAVSPAAEKNTLEAQMMKNSQNQMMLKQGGAPQGAAPPPGMGASSPPSMAA